MPREAVRGPVQGAAALGMSAPPGGLPPLGGQEMTRMSCEYMTGLREPTVARSSKRVSPQAQLVVTEGGAVVPASATWWVIGGVLVVTAVVVAGVLIGLRRRSKHRDQALSSMASARGMAYNDRDDSLTDRYTGEGYARHVVEGERLGRPFAVFESSHTEHSDDEPRVVDVTVAAIQTRYQLPKIRCEVNRRVLPGVMPSWRFRTGDEEFDRRFRVETDDLPSAAAVLTPAVREAILSDGRKPLMVLFKDDAVVLVTKGLYRPGRFDQVVEPVEQIVAGISGSTQTAKQAL